MAAARALVWGIPAAITVFACLCLDRRFAGRLWNVPVLLGDASYSIYLFHLTVINMLQLNWIAEIGISIACGLVAYRLVERRFRNCVRIWRDGVRGLIACRTAA